jgi:hypothetical protein
MGSDAETRAEAAGGYMAAAKRTLGERIADHESAVERNQEAQINATLALVEAVLSVGQRIAEAKGD